MNLFARQVASHFHDVFFGSPWTGKNYFDALADVHLNMACFRLQDTNSIATIVNHIAYYLAPVRKTLQGLPLEASDRASFEIPEPATEDTFAKAKAYLFSEAKNIVSVINEMTDEQMLSDFYGNKYGNCYKNIVGIIEHCHYHLGQIILIKKVYAASTAT